MSISTIVILVMNILILLFMAVGFLRGLKGLKFTLARFVFFLLAFGITLVLLEYVCNTIIASIKIGGKSINELIASAMLNNDFIAGLYNSSDKLKQVINQIPNVAIRSVTFSILFLIIHIICNIAYSFVKSLILLKMEWFNKKTAKEILKDEDSKSLKVKKIAKNTANSPIFGGLVGAFLGLCILTTLMLPVSGLIGIVTDVVHGKYASAETVLDTMDMIMENTDKIEITNDISGENVFEGVMIVFDNYENTLVARVGSIGKFDRGFARQMSAITVDGKRVLILDKVEVISQLYSDITYMVEFANNFTGIGSLENLNVTKLKRIVEYVMDNELFDTMFDDIFNYTYTYLNEKSTTNEEVKQFLDQLIIEINAKGSAKNYIKDEIINSLDVAEDILNAHIINNIIDLQNAENDTDKIKAITSISTRLVAKKIDDPSKSYIESAIGRLKNSKTLNLATCMLVNIELKTLETKIRSLVDEELPEKFLGRIDIATTSINFDTLGTIADKMTNIFIQYSELLKNTDSQTKLHTVLTKKVGDKHLITYTVDNLGDIAQMFMNSDILKTQAGERTIFENLCYYLGKTEIINFINIEELSKPNAITYEKNLIENSMEILLESEFYQNFISENYDKTNTTNDILNLLKATNGEHNNAYVITENLLNTKLFRKGIVKVINSMSEKITNYAGSDVKGFNTAHLFDDEKVKVCTFASDMVIYYSSIYSKDVEMKYAIVNGDYVELGKLIDEFKSLELVADTEEGQGFYNATMTALAENKNDYFDTSVALNDEFSWETTMTNYGETIYNLLNEEIQSIEGTVTIAQIILGDSVQTFEYALNQLGEDKIAQYSSNLEGCELLAPLQAKLQNHFAE